MRYFLLFLLLLPAIALATAGPSSAQTCSGYCVPTRFDCNPGDTYTVLTIACHPLGYMVCCTPTFTGGISGITPPSGLLFTNAITLIGDIVSRFLLFAISLAGIYFLYRLITAGYEYLTSVGDPGKIQSGTKQLTNAITGLIIVITAFFIIQIIEFIFRVNIL